MDPPAQRLWSLRSGWVSKAIESSARSPCSSNSRRLTAWARRYEEAEGINEARTAFVASVSHELRTPLIVVVGLAHGMRDGLETFSAPEIEEVAGLIAAESNEVAWIFEDLLVAARAETGSVTMIREGVDLRSQLERVLRLDHVLAGHEVDVVANGDTVATADGARVRQIVRKPAVQRCQVWRRTHRGGHRA